eukprot:14213903-Ditylum_brightwellii.AAC.1
MTLRKACGSYNPGTRLNQWHDSIIRCSERRKRKNVSITDIKDAKKFAINSNIILTPTGEMLKREVVALVDYFKYMQSLNKNPMFKFDNCEEDDVPGIDDLFQKAAK